MDYPLRPAEPRDLGAINEIYNYYVVHTTSSYQETPMSLAAREEWWSAHRGRFPVIVAEDEERLLGWASLSSFVPRSGYRYTVEDSVYVRHDCHRRGIGRALLSELLERGRTAGFKVVLALIAGEQDASVRLHAALGFRQVGRLERVGLKFGRWMDTVIMQREL